MTPISDHLDRVLATVAPLPPREVPLADAWDRRIAEPVRALVPIPLWRSSSMDGYAVRYDDVASADDAPVTLRVVADIPAGSDLDPALAPGDAARIMTGAVLPTDADTIVQLEHTDRLDPLAPVSESVEVRRAPSRGLFVRGIGDDLATGDLVAGAGTLTTAGVLAAVSSAGHGTLRVHRAPRVTVIATGSELVAPGEPVRRGQIPDANSLMVAALVRRAGGEVDAVAQVGDDPAELESALARAGGSDVVVLTGGVSAGAYDPVKQVFDGSRDVTFTSVSMQPGKPQAFGTLPGGAVLFGLPGNPVSAWVSFHVFVRPALLAMQGAPDGEVRLAPVPGRAGADWGTPPGRTQILPARLSVSGGVLTATPVHALGSKSHLTGSLALAGGYAVVPAEVERVQAGDAVDVVLIGADLPLAAGEDGV
ncbi:molybdopterin molybdotransferase MoeA [Litorihabitans aurantiacus]|uniref:Molybdopterin molybdenumtransferase n=1 Tax=Litorihabitans aurantiacus TaxID=1930061 RepID=A0AA38CUF4_9MICO|nr:gephyrin-like molybdotransferase Glp [Litorihabitans aurantiacus]GMA33326.1 molybdopterin molybdenumtransferase MoeA [Litorihabitans aurantiacus]